jgi:hypothetical protein
MVVAYFIPLGTFSDRRPKASTLGEQCPRGRISTRHTRHPEESAADPRLFLSPPRVFLGKNGILLGNKEQREKHFWACAIERKELVQLTQWRSTKGVRPMEIYAEVANFRPLGL